MVVIAAEKEFEKEKEGKEGTINEDIRKELRSGRWKGEILNPPLIYINIKRLEELECFPSTTTHISSIVIRNVGGSYVSPELHGWTTSTIINMLKL